MKREDKRLAIWLKTEDGQEIDIWHYGEDGKRGRERAEKWAGIIESAIRLEEEQE